MRESMYTSHIAATAAGTAAVAIAADVMTARTTSADRFQGPVIRVNAVSVFCGLWSPFVLLS